MGLWGRSTSGHREAAAQPSEAGHTAIYTTHFRFNLQLLCVGFFEVERNLNVQLGRLLLSLC
jgi:hypothetical protein